MFNIAQLLEKFKSIKDPSIEKEKIAEVVAQLTGLQIKKEDISVKNQVVFVKIAPTAKMAVFLKKAQIIAQIKAILPELLIIDIR